MKDIKKGEFAAAKLVYEEIRKPDPKNAVALQLSGVLASQVGQQEISVNLLSRAIALKPDYADAFYNRITLHRQQFPGDWTHILDELKLNIEY